MPTPAQVVVALVEGAVLATVASAAQVVVVSVMVASVAQEVVVSVVREEVFLMVDLAGHMVAQVDGVVVLGVAAAGEGVRGAVVGTAAGVAAHGAGVIRIMVGAMVEDRGAILTGAAAGAGGRRLCSVRCLV
ncbi:hypothetical protein NBRC3299_2507 [Acetobacter pasteurianus NBRC 3299]|uniref:Uncharacterized protein n=1 Tax=Acetobacter ascendens TaxID=481146 RepID=A0A1Y0V336_9PROT|nr:hypothetical protein S101447_01276 [Acetobacter ascendens]RCL08908.1 hypothetical protein BBA71_02480 [Acetobacter pasteurianus]GCD76215.1 hypothetical protein NBRC3299_2507 [Acetobacter pasteurianus NBRC 3299]